MKPIKIERNIWNDDLVDYVTFSIDTKEIYDRESALRFLERDEEVREITTCSARTMLDFFFCDIQEALLERFH